MQYEYWYQYTIFLKKIKAKNYIIKVILLLPHAARAARNNGLDSTIDNQRCRGVASLFFWFNSIWKIKKTAQRKIFANLRFRKD